MEPKDLKIGDIYKAGSGMCFLNKILKIDEFNFSGCSIEDNERFYKEQIFTKINMSKASLEEEHWLNTCYNLQKFISYEEAMLTFVDPLINYQQDIEYNNILIKLLTTR